MLATVSAAALLGVDAYKVQVEVDIAGGLPKVFIVGLPGPAVQESQERVRSAIRNAGLPFPASRVVVNLAPADIRKEGPAFDLPIAIAVLAAQGVIPQEALTNTIINGELALDGSLRPIKGAINISLLASGVQSINQCILPPSNAAEAAVIDDVAIIAPKNLSEAVAFLQGNQELKPAIPADIIDKYPLPDLQDVKGQAAAKRALEIAAAGMHNILFTGPPGAGKTMLAKRILGILPNLTRAEAIEVTRIHSTAGMLTQSGLLRKPPFRNPHHTVSYAGLIGGGNIPRPGEVSLAHRGVLFLDEFPEFSRRALEVLRQPLEDGVVTISRARAALTFPAQFMLVASQNPCPCGHYGDPEHLCTCSLAARQRYKNRISGPLLDRIDLHLTVPRLPASDLLDIPISESSVQVKERVIVARERMLHRQGIPNSELVGKALRTHTKLSENDQEFVHTLINKLALSGRGFDRLLRVARTIADLVGSENISQFHLAEAARYRTM